MSKGKEFEYTKVKDLMVVGDKNKRHQVVELGYWTIDGIKKKENVYVYDYYFNRDGELVKGNKAVTSMTVELYNALSGNR